MILYTCETCNVNMETDTCTSCGRKTISKSEIYWCKQCNIPIFDSICLCCNSRGNYIGTDIRPVFPKEKLLLGIILEEEDPLTFSESSVWCSKSRYIIDGEKKTISLRELNRLPLNEFLQIRMKYDEYVNQIDTTYFNDMKQKFIKANKARYNQINEESVRYINTFKTRYPLEEMFVSFSGGKDSTVTSHIVTKALGTNNIIHIFGDTTLEFQKTHEYIKRFRSNEKTKGIPMISAKNREQDFEELCKVIGPPSRVMRWCCTVFKTGAISRTISLAFKDKTNILTFYGIRRSESASRSKYERESESPKIAKQTVVSPIIDWIDFDVWLYILTEDIDFNEAYELGYSRVGCWCCPNNGSWSEILAKIFMYDKYTNWRDILVGFAKQIGKPDAEEYVDSGNWKARQGGNGLELSETSIVAFEPCVAEDNAFNYELQKPITEDLYELFKPFGYINKELGNKRLGQVYVLDKNNNVVLILQGRIGTNKLKVTINKQNLAKTRSVKEGEGKIQCQITKYQMCMECRACEGVCKYNAISLKNNIEGNIKYKINDEKCVRCGDCVGHFDSGCYMRRVLRVKRR